MQTRGRILPASRTWPHHHLDPHRDGRCTASVERQLRYCAYVSDRNRRLIHRTIARSQVRAPSNIRDLPRIQFPCLRILKSSLQSVTSICVGTRRDHCLSHICEPAFSEMRSAPYHRRERCAGRRFAACAGVHVLEMPSCRPRCGMNYAKSCGLSRLWEDCRRWGSCSRLPRR